MMPNLLFAAFVAVFATMAILWVQLGEPWVQARADRRRVELEDAEYQAWLNRGQQANPYRHDHNPLNADFHGGICPACEWGADDAGTVAGRVLFVVAVIAATIVATLAVS